MLTRISVFVRRKAGFSLVEVLVALAIMTILAAVLIPGLTAKLEDSRRSSISQTLSGLNSALAEYKKAVGRYPGELTMLTTKPTTSDRDLCGTLMTASSTLLWRGPYLSREFIAAGIPVGDAIIDPDIRRSPTTVTSTPPVIAYALIDVAGVESSTASELDLELDGVADNLTGAILYTTGGIAAQGSGNPTNAIPAPSSTSQVNLTYAIPINPYSC